MTLIIVICGQIQIASNLNLICLLSQVQMNDAGIYVCYYAWYAEFRVRVSSAVVAHLK